VVNNLKKFRYSDQKRRKKAQLVRKRMPYAHVLVVDDVATNLDVAKGMLNPYGLQIDCASSGQEAVDAIRREKTKYDAVFMDHMMPEMDGIEAARIIREEIGSEYARAVPIIALTANAIVGNEEMFLGKGFQGFISKPIDVMQLDSILNIWIRDRQSEETLLQAEKETPVQANGRHIFRDANLDGIDIADGIRRYSTEQAYLQIIRSYHLHTPVILEKMETLGQPAGISLADYMIIVHGLKGSSYSISANAVGREAGKLEAAAKAGDMEEAMKGNGPLIAMAKLLLSDLGDFLQKPAGREEKTGKSAPDHGLLERLLEAAKEFKTATMEQIITQLESFEYESGGELITWLREQLDNLEYAAICSRLSAAE
jgi:CheY-like chemotaxis protein